MADEESAKLTITGKLSYSDDITVTQAAQIVAFLNADQGVGLPTVPLAGANAGLLGSAPTPQRPAQSPRDALEASGAKTNPERIVAFGLSITQQGGRETFTIDEI